ncbi:MAG: efflux RND transporter periplasmic adaptor subunit [Thermoanaerobaculia bacterium]
MRFAAASIVLLPIAALSLGCGGSRSDASSRATEPVLRVSRGDFRQVLHLTGEIEAAEGVSIVVPRIPNWQTTIRTIVTDGSRVEAGALLAELDSTQFSTGLEQKRDAHADAIQERTQQAARSEADLEKLELDLETSRIELEKAKTRAAIPPEILPRREYEDNQLALRRAEVVHEKARNDLESRQRAAKADLANVEIRIAQTREEIVTAEAAIESMTLRAPSAGVVIIGENRETGRKFQAGDAVWVGNELLSIPNLDTLRVSAIVVDVGDGEVVRGQRAEITPDAYPEIRLIGTVESVTTAANSLRPESLRRGFEAMLLLDDATQRDKLRPGFSVRVTIVRSEGKGVLLIPRAALEVRADERLARHRNGKLVPVTLGECNDHECVVLGGVDEGEFLGGPTAESPAS